MPNSQPKKISTLNSSVSGNGLDEDKKLSVTIEEYRKILGDYKSPDNKVIKRIQYLEALCKNIIQSELQNYGKHI